MSESIIFYRSFYDAIVGSGLNDADQLAAFKAICEYGLYGTEQKITGLPYGIFVIARESIDANARKREGGKKGGRPKNETSGFESENQRFPKGENTVTGTGTITDTFTVTGTGTGTDKADSPPAPQKKDISFVPPSLNEVQQLCKDKGYVTSPTKFYYHYQASGWEHVKDWRSKLAAWNEDDAKKQVSNKTDSGGIADSAPDAGELERMRKLRERLRAGTL